MLEGQVEELEVMNDEYQDREDQWNILKSVELDLSFAFKLFIILCYTLFYTT